MTTRGQKHLEELMHVASSGMRAIIFFFVGRTDITHFEPADNIDPTYGKLLRQAVSQGVEAIAYTWALSPNGVHELKKTEIKLP